MGWDTRLAWSGEVPLGFPELNPVALQRFAATDDGTFADHVDPAQEWAVPVWGGTAGTTAGRWGVDLGLNLHAPATEQHRLTLPHFSGLWPSSGRLLIGMWVRQTYAMTFNPLLSTRGGSSPLVYLSTYSGGSPRQQVYGPTGSLVLDSYETPSWTGTLGWQWVGQYLDMDNLTSRILVVERDTGQTFVGPARALSGAPNLASTADLDVLSLQTASFWSSGYVDEVLVAHPGAEFDPVGFVDAIARGTWARGADTDAAGKLTVTDSAVTADVAHTLHTGAESVTWAETPEPSIPSAIPYRSTDGGATWLTGALPSAFTGLLRWDVPLTASDTFTGLELLPPSPTFAPIADQAMVQRGTITVPLTATWSGTPAWTVAAVGVTASVSGTTLTIDSGWASGEVLVVVTLRDEWDRPVSQEFTLTVSPEPWTPPPPPQYPRTPIVVWDEDGPSEAIIDAMSAVVKKEVNGEHTLELSIPVKHRHAAAILPERVVELAREKYRVRRITTGRIRRVPALVVYAEAEYYDLAYAGQIDAREWLQTSAGAVMEEALDGTGWTVGAVTVTTRRTYALEENTTPLGLLRLVQKQHGGDLLFDGEARTVSLVTQSGRDSGVSFFYERGLSDSKRVVDTTSLVTRIYARNADGVTIASVNDGVPYVEDFTWTDEVREATYNFAAGASPFTMLAMAQLTLANRSKPSYSYEFTIADLSHKSGQAADAFDVGDTVTVVDDELAIRETQRVLRVEHDVIRPWQSKITLSGKLRELGSRAATEAGDLTTGSPFGAFDLVPYNLLKNGRFDSALAHWAASGVSVVDGDGTGDYAVRFAGSGTRWIEQTVQPDNRDVYALSLRVKSSAAGAVPSLKAIATVRYEDGTTEAIPIELA